MPGLSSTTAAGLARRMAAGQWKAAEAGLAVVTERMVSLLPAPRAAAQDQAAAAEHWYRHRTSIEPLPRHQHGAALRHLPSGYAQASTA